MLGGGLFLHHLRSRPTNGPFVAAGIAGPDIHASAKRTLAAGGLGSMRIIRGPGQKEFG
jgi:hypothetical protein